MQLLLLERIFFFIRNIADSTIKEHYLAGKTKILGFIVLAKLEKPPNITEGSFSYKKIKNEKE
jgi:hypothetical protein